jgi:acetylornithine deacetylase/succinyl-diaminopimelate desuccinylase-like protein
VGSRVEVTTLLQELLRVNTVNPPGNETHAAEVLREYFARDGIECELYAREPGRANVVARISGGDGPTLAFLSHTDTVLADPAEWDRDPWSGDLVDGEVWGRGALDMKSQVAASAVAFATLRREGFTPAGDLVFVSVADEEVGVGLGLSWLVEAHPEAVRCDYAVNEGGGERLVLDGSPLYLCATAEKMSAPFQLVVHGRSGHASLPGIADNALVKAAELVERIDAFRQPPQLGPETAVFLERVTGSVPDPEQALDAARRVDEAAAEVLEPLLAMTVAPTQIVASDKRNVIPGRCTVGVDCRLLPGQAEEDADRALRAWLGDGEYELSWRGGQGGTRSPADTVLWQAVEEFVTEAEPGAVVLPTCVPGFTDSHWLRDAFGTVAYGFFPIRTMSAELAARLVHSADERIEVADLELGLEFLRHAALSVCSP